MAFTEFAVLSYSGRRQKRAKIVPFSKKSGGSGFAQNGGPQGDYRPLTSVGEGVILMCSGGSTFSSAGFPTPTSLASAARIFLRLDVALRFPHNSVPF
jgi:hypothetical protein